MRKITLFFALLLSLVMLMSACDNYVTDVDKLIDKVEDEYLTSEAQMNFLITGIWARFANTIDQLGVAAGLLSDELYFDANVPQSTYPTHRDIDIGQITLNNNTVDTPHRRLGEWRFFADDLLRRADALTFEDAALEAEVRFTANFFGGVTRFIYAAYFALDETTPGGVIDAGPFIPAADMYALAIAKLEAALAVAPDAWTASYCNTMLARVNLFAGNYAAASTAAANGLAVGDAPMQGLHSDLANNYYYTQAGRGRCQAVVDNRFQAYIDADANEANRIIIEDIVGNDGVTVYKMQAYYTTQGSPQTYLSWEENELMLGELAFRNGDNATALTHLNNVRSYYGIADLTAVDMTVIEQEREKTLLVQAGLRLPDQNRIGTWHLPAGTWRYLPIMESERNANPNID